ncbi:MAG TPA: glycosyltransferase family 2 protein [Ferruginibacter sp.]|nr:glycosyltransferase family 2 protein [Ferruginibacter sp.]
MRVTLITATYNSERYLADAIESILSQTHPDIEHIIVDGKSGDGTVAIIRRYENRIARWLSETDRGMYDAINKGMQMATGEIIGILNSDDMLASDDVVAEIVRTFEEKKIDSLYGDLEYVDAADTNKIYRIWKGKPYRRSLFRSGWMPAHPTFYFKRSLLETCGYYENHYFSAADYEFMARYLFKHRVSSYYLPKLIVKMRLGGQSNSSLYKRLRANRRDYLAMKKNKIPFAFFVSILKPLSKIHQFYKK